MMARRSYSFHKAIGKRASEIECCDSQKRGRYFSDEHYNREENDSYIVDNLEKGGFGTGNVFSKRKNLASPDEKWSGDVIHQYSDYRIKFTSKNNPTSIFDDNPEERRMIASELSIICDMEHDHIIKVHEISSSPEMEPYVVIDKLTCSLAGKIQEWRDKGHSSDLRERLCILHTMASALDYLHDKKILYRSLDPCKVGFDGKGTVKLFDFSLAKCLSDQSGSFLLTAMAGSPLYMAPEVYRGDPYGFSVDVFSLCILAWETLMLEHIAFGDEANYVDAVLGRGQRPNIPLDLPLILRNILRYGWAKKSSTRPTIKVIYTAMDQFLYSRSFDSPEMEYIQVILQSNGTFLEF